jgi:exosome complex component RRP40
VLSFEGATKRSKPNLKVGALVYARVVQADRHSEPELSCVDLQTGKGEGLGELKVGGREEGLCTIFKVSIPLAGSMLMPSHPLLPALSTNFPFEAAVGHNGIVWVRAAGPRQLIAFGKVLEAADKLDVYSIASRGRVRTKQTDQEDGDAEMADQKDDGLTAQDVVKLRGRLPEAEIKRIVQQYVA